MDKPKKKSTFVVESNCSQMTLIKSISGIRGTIGGVPGDALTPRDIVTFVSAYVSWLTLQGEPVNKTGYRVVVGRDARISGKIVDALVCNTLLSMGVDVVNAGLATTPTVEMAVDFAEADGGIILTASHNPANWNALKLLNSRGEFLSAADGQVLLDLAERALFEYADVDHLGTLIENDFLDDHIQAILALPEVDAEAIRTSGFKVVVDPVNSVGGIAIPALLNALGVEEVTLLNGTPDGRFAHNPEPLAEHLTGICEKVPELEADLGIVVDPDVDRLALVNHDGSLFGEEYTLVAVSDYLLAGRPGNTVSNLSSTRALCDVTEKHGGHYYSAAVGEVNVVAKMKEVGALIGGEGNGGIIFPALHYGRDALVGIALILSAMAKTGRSLKEMRGDYPDYAMSKNKIQLPAEMNPDELLHRLRIKYQDQQISLIDGVKIEFANSWVHMRKSNTEPIIRIYTEAPDAERAQQLAERFVKEIQTLSGLE